MSVTLSVEVIYMLYHDVFQYLMPCDSDMMNDCFMNGVGWGWLTLYSFLEWLFLYVFIDFVIPVTYLCWIYHYVFHHWFIYLAFLKLLFNIKICFYKQVTQQKSDVNSNKKVVFIFYQISIFTQVLCYLFCLFYFLLNFWLLLLKAEISK